MAPSTFETLPAEILNEIFQHSCCDEIDLDLLAVSRRVRAVLVKHPVARVLGALCMQRWKNQVMIISRPKNDEKSTAKATTPLSQTTDETTTDLATRPWCSRGFLLNVQIALIRRLVRVFWQPLLCRDGAARPPQTTFDVLDDVLRSCHDPMRGDEVTFVLTDTVNKYPWTRVQVWPVQGRVLVRDQLLNECLELTVKLNDLFPLEDGD